MTEKKRVTFTVKPANKRWLDNFDNKSAFVDRVLTHARKTGTQDQAVVELQIKQKQRELETVEERAENIRQDIRELRQQRKRAVEKEDAQLDDARDALEMVELTPTNPAVQNWADRLDMTEQELINHLQQ